MIPRGAQAYNKASNMCMRDWTKCDPVFDMECKLTGNYDPMMECVESCVSDRFYTFESAEGLGLNKALCDEPVLAAMELTPDLFKSCLSRTYDCTAGGANVCEDGCYDCISGCVMDHKAGESLSLSQDCAGRRGDGCAEIEASARVERL